MGARMAAQKKIVREFQPFQTVVVSADKSENVAS